MEYYLVLSTIMMFVGIYGFVTRRNLLAMLISVELILNQFRRIQPLPVPRTAGGILLHAIRHRHQRRRNGRRNRHHHQHLPEPAQHRGEEPAGDEVVTILKKRLLWNIRSLSCCCRC
jgi:hypothetical protein